MREEVEGGGGARVKGGVRKEGREPAWANMVLCGLAMKNEGAQCALSIFQRLV